MTRIPVLALVVSCVATAFAEDSPGTLVGGVVYHRDVEEAFERARFEKKLVFLWRLLGELDGGC